MHTGFSILSRCTLSWSISAATSKFDRKAVALRVAVLKRVHAENIVRFIGVCITQQYTLLVTEFIFSIREIVAPALADVTRMTVIWPLA